MDLLYSCDSLCVFLTLLIQWGAYVFVVKRVGTFDARCLHDAVAGHVVVAGTLPATG